MNFIQAQLKIYAKKALKYYREKQLAPGEVGWGKPSALPAYVPNVGADVKRRVAIIGIGPQGIAQCQALLSIKGVQIAGVADINQERLNEAVKKLKLPASVAFTDADAMLKSIGKVDLVSIATTAAFHVSLGRIALKNGAKKIMLEKPIDISLAESRKFRDECKAAGAELIVNYSRRWLIDANAVKRVIDKGYIGNVKSISVMVGKGEVAMIASHYFDFCNMILGSAPVSVQAKLEPLKEQNRRGGNYNDPYGYATYTYPQGQRAFLDFSSDLLVKNSQMLIKGDNGYIMIDESNLYWTVQVMDQKLWTIPFAEPIKSSLSFARVAAQVIADKSPAPGTAEDGIAALEMILAAHISSNAGGITVNMPLTDEEADLKIVFP